MFGLLSLLCSNRYTVRFTIVLLCKSKTVFYSPDTDIVNPCSILCLYYPALKCIHAVIVSSARSISPLPLSSLSSSSSAWRVNASRVRGLYGGTIYINIQHSRVYPMQTNSPIHAELSIECDNNRRQRRRRLRACDFPFGRNSRDSHKSCAAPCRLGAVPDTRCPYVYACVVRQSCRNTRTLARVTNTCIRALAESGCKSI